MKYSKISKLTIYGTSTKFGIYIFLEFKKKKEICFIYFIFINNYILISPKER